MKLSIKNKWLFTGVEIILVVALLAGSSSGLMNFNQKRKIKSLSEENVKQSERIDSLVGEIDTLNKTKDDIVEQKERVEKGIRQQASTGFSILYEQASDIKDEFTSPFTSAHLHTAKEYVKVWGYDSMARLIKWQQDQIENQLKETRRLMEEEQKLRTEYLHFKVEAEKTILQTKHESENHKKTAESLHSKVGEFMASNSWLKNVMQWIVIGTLVYAFITFGGFGLLIKKDLKHSKAAEIYKRKKNKIVKAVKTFKNVDNIGNETMDKVLSSIGIDLDSEDEDDD